MKDRYVTVTRNDTTYQQNTATIGRRVDLSARALVGGFAFGRNNPGVRWSTIKP